MTFNIFYGYELDKWHQDHRGVQTSYERLKYDVGYKDLTLYIGDNIIDTEGRYYLRKDEEIPVYEDLPRKKQWEYETDDGRKKVVDKRFLYTLNVHGNYFYFHYRILVKCPIYNDVKTTGLLIKKTKIKEIPYQLPWKITYTDSWGQHHEESGTIELKGNEAEGYGHTLFKTQYTYVDFQGHTIPAGIY